MACANCAKEVTVEINDALVELAQDVLPEAPHALRMAIKDRAGIPRDEPLEILSLEDAAAQSRSDSNNIAVVLLFLCSTANTKVRPQAA